MFAKSTQIGLVSLFAVLATALGGCAETVGNEPASYAASTRPTIALSRFAAPLQEPTDSFQSLKTESVSSRTEARRVFKSAVADAR
jgi:hypothetical protein